MTPTSSPIPLSLHTSNHGSGPQINTPGSISSLTPPVTPIGKETKDPARSIPSPVHDSIPAQTDVLLKQDINTPTRFTDDLEICHDSEDRPIEFGRGAWSIVYKARSTTTPSTPMHTPPTSPATVTRIYAVKAPLRRDAATVLQAEALTLTRLMCTPNHLHHVIPFHGYHASTNAIVMTAVPLALSTYIEDQADLARKRAPSTATMFDPVQGPSSWLAMARKLISALAWLHSTAGVVHGDIKPHNLLLRAQAEEDEPASPFPYEPLLADFSSAVGIPSDGAPPDPARVCYSAFTPPFTAPELLSLASLKTGTAAPTPASDVFSLAATLVAAATGDLLLYPGSNSMQRLAMARDGHQILNFTRSGPNAARVPRKGVVEGLVVPAVAKEPGQRIGAVEWAGLAASLE